MRLFAQRLLVLFGAALLLSSCLTPRITRRYRAQTRISVPTGQIEAGLSAFAMPTPTSQMKGTLSNLSERAQASLIRELGRKSNTADAVLGAIDKHPESQRLDHTTWDRRIVFSVENRSSGQADRISAARIRIDALTPPALFQSWTEFATKYDSVDLGTLRMTEHRELAGTAGSLTNAGTASARQSQDREETVKLSERYVALTGSLSPQSAELIQQGAPGMDLTGNVAVDLTIRVPDTKQTDVFRFANDRVTRHTIQYTAKPADIAAQGTLIVTIRKVLTGDRTLTESDDQVEFRTGETQPLRMVLVPAEEQIVHIWVLRDASGARLHFGRPSQPELIQFGSYESALAFRAAAANPQSLIGERLVLPPSAAPVDVGHAAALQVEVITLNPPR